MCASIPKHNTNSTTSLVGLFGFAVGSTTVISQEGATSPTTFDFLRRRRQIREGDERQLAEHREQASELAALIRRNNALQIGRNRLIGPGPLLTPPLEAAQTPISPEG